MRFFRKEKTDLLYIIPKSIYHIPWKDNIHSPTQTQPWRTLLAQKKLDESSHGYLPYFSHLEGDDLQWWQQEFESLLSNSPVFLGEWQDHDKRVMEFSKMVADWETEDISCKLRYLYYLYDTKQIAPDISYWHNRALHHADQLYEFERKPFDLTQVEEAKYVMQFADEDQQDYWRQVISFQEELPQKDDKLRKNVPHQRKRYNLRSSPQEDDINTLQNHSDFHVVELPHGRGSLTKINNEPPLNIQKISCTKKIWLKEADARTVCTWLTVNKEFFDTLDKNQIKIYYKPRTQKRSWNSINTALLGAGFSNIFQKFE